MSSATQRTGDAAAATDSAVRPGGSRPHDPSERIQAGLERGKHAADTTISEHPGSAVLLSFVLGAGVGTLIGTLLFERPPWRRRREPETLIQRIAETVSCAVREALPANLRS